MRPTKDDIIKAACFAMRVDVDHCLHAPAWQTTVPIRAARGIALTLGKKHGLGAAGRLCRDWFGASKSSAYYWQGYARQHPKALSEARRIIRDLPRPKDPEPKRGVSKLYSALLRSSRKITPPGVAA